MKRFPIILPAAAAALASLGGLMYAGSAGYNCVGPYDNRGVAHPPVGWQEYLGVCVVVLAASLIPLLAWRKGDPLRSSYRRCLWSRSSSKHRVPSQ